MLKTILRSGRRSQHGVTLVEFALTLPILLFLVIGFFDLGLAVYSKNTVASSAREGARRAIIVGATDTQIRTAVRNTAVGLPLSDSDILISPSNTRSSGDPVVVTVNYLYAPITPFIGRLVFGGNTLLLSSQAQMVVE
jgi:Flp pilus assembly protein TadG